MYITPTEIVNFEVGKSQEITLQPKLHSPVAGSRIWMAIGNTSAVLECKPELNTEQTDHKWLLKGVSGFGDFQPGFLGPEFGRAAWAPRCRLLPERFFRYINFLGDPLPLPPIENRVYVNTLFAAGVKLTEGDGTPLANVKVTFYAEEKEPQIIETDAKGVAGSVPYMYPTLGVRKFSAVAELPQEEVTTEALVRVLPPTDTL